MLILAIALAWGIGALLLHLLWPREWLGRALLVRLPLSYALGLGLTSCHLLLWLEIAKTINGFFWSEIVLATSLAAVAWLRRPRRAQTTPPWFVSASPPTGLQRMVAIAFALVVVCAAFMFVLFSLREPHGLFDAVGMWNAKARIIYRSGGEWRHVISPYVSHPDYPVLLPLSIARGWFLAGAESRVFPAALAMLFTFGIAGLLVAAVATLQSRTQGMLAGLVLLAPIVFVRFGSWQYADFAIALYVLATIVLVCLHERAPPGNKSLLVLAGLTAGFAAWTKNEGLLFVLVTGAGYGLVASLRRDTRTRLRGLIWLAAGMLPVLLVIAYFKSQVQTPNDLMAGQSAQSMVAQLSDISRYELIAKALLQQVVFFGGWELNPLYLLLLYPLAVGMDVGAGQRFGVLTGTAILALLFLGYMMIYLLTPRPLEWHLMTSLDRLLLHLWPGSVFVYFLVARTPEDALAQVPAYHS